MAPAGIAISPTDAGQLLVEWNPPGAGTSRLTAHVDEVRAEPGLLHCSLDGGVDGEELSTVGERVRGHVQHSHDKGSVQRG